MLSWRMMDEGLWKAISSKTWSLPFTRISEFRSMSWFSRLADLGYTDYSKEDLSSATKWALEWRNTFLQVLLVDNEMLCDGAGEACMKHHMTTAAELWGWARLLTSTLHNISSNEKTFSTIFPRLPDKTTRSFRVSYMLSGRKCCKLPTITW